MFYNYYHAEDSEYNECNARGACSIAPKISSLQEVLIMFLKHMAYYTLKLYNMNAGADEEINQIIKGVASIISTTDYTDEQILALVGKYYSSMIKMKRKYFKICEDNNVSADELKLSIKITPQMNLARIIAQGEHLFLDKYRKLPASQKNMTEILLFILKNVCINLLDLESFGEKYDEAKISVLKGLDTLNAVRVYVPVLKDKIKELVDVNDRLLERISEAQIKCFGTIKLKSVSQNTSSGKAILVSGGSLSNLFTLLVQTEGKDIGVYTHGDLLIAHAFENFSKMKNLKGHYGACTENCVLDFATFPGAILLTQNSYQNIEYLYRGRLFTTEDIQPTGVVKLTGNDYSKLIDSAENAKGFAKDKTFPSVTAGYDREMLEEFCDILTDNFRKGNIKRVIVIGPSTKNFRQNEYFDNFLKLIPHNNLVISFSYHNDNDNCVHFNLVNNFPAIYTVLKRIFRDIPITQDNIAFFITRCDITSISHLISLKNRGAKNIFLSNCQPKINPSISATLRSVYGIKSITTPQEDIKSL